MSIDVDEFLRRCTPSQRRRLLKELNKHPGARAELVKALEDDTRGEPVHAGALVVPDRHTAPGRCTACGGKSYAPKRAMAAPEFTRGGQAVAVEVLCSHPFHTRSP